MKGLNFMDCISVVYKNEKGWCVHKYVGDQCEVTPKQHTNS